jgi:hypothetical protein
VVGSPLEAGAVEAAGAGVLTGGTVGAGVAVSGAGAGAEGVGWSAFCRSSWA